MSQRFAMITPEAKATLNDIGMSDAEMFHFQQSTDKPYDEMLLLHTISTKDRISKWDGKVSDPTREFPYKITSNDSERVIKLFIAA